MKHINVCFLVPNIERYITCIAIYNYVTNHLAIVSSLVELIESALQFPNYKILQYSYSNLFKAWHLFLLPNAKEVIHAKVIYCTKKITKLYVLIKALPPVCMKYTARDESRVANIARGEAKCYICHKTLIKSCILSYKRSGSVLSVLLYFTLTKVLAKYSSLAILTHSLNK